jgi:hypothetical protein
MERLRKVVFTLLAASMLVGAFAAATASASGQTVLCREAVITCPAASIKPAGTELATGVAPYAPYSGNLEFEAGSLNTIVCSNAAFDNKTKEVAGLPLNAELSGSYLGGCHPAGTTTLCSSIGFNTVPETIEATSPGGSGVIRMGTEVNPLIFSFDCFNSQQGFQIACSFKASFVEQVVNPYVEPEVSFKEAVFTKVSQTKGFGIGCGGTKTLKMSGIRSERGIYISKN